MKSVNIWRLMQGHPDFAGIDVKEVKRDLLHLTCPKMITIEKSHLESINCYAVRAGKFDWEEQCREQL
jgi:hypothetical protein